MVDEFSNNTASETTTLAPRSTRDSDTTQGQGLPEKITLDAEIKSPRSFGDRWREFRG